MKRTLRLVAVAAAIIILAVVALPFLIDADRFRPMLESELTTALNREVKLGHLNVALLSGGVTADDLSIADDPAFSRNPFLHAKSLKLSVDVLPLLLSRKLNVNGLTVDQPEISLVQTPAGVWNFASFGSKTPPASAAAKAASSSAPLDLSVKLIKITNGRLSLAKTSSHAKPQALEKLDLEVRDFSASSSFPFSVSASISGGGSIKLDGKAGPIAAPDATVTPFEANLKVTNLDLASSGFIDASSGIAGIASIDGSAISDGATVKIHGKLNGEKLKLARNGLPATRGVEFDFALDHNLAKHSGVLREGAVHIGKAAANLTGNYAEKGATTILNVNFSGPAMPIPELEGMLPSLGIVLPAGSSLQGGTASAKLSAEGTLDRLIVSGPVGLANTKLTGFDLGSKLSTIEKLAGIQSSPSTAIQELSATIKATPEGTEASEIKLVVPSIGEIGGAGNVNAAQVLDFKMHATMQRLGSTSVPFTITGTASEPSFKPDLKGLATQELKNLTGGDAKKAATGLIKGLLGGKK